MDRDSTDRIVDFECVLNKRDAEANQNAGDEADDCAAGRVDETAGRGDRDQAGQKAVGAHRSVGLALEHPHVKQCAKGSGATSQHGVDGDRADAEATSAGSAERAAGIESEPAEGQDEATDQHGRDVVADDRIGRTIAVELADARADDRAPLPEP